VDEFCLSISNRLVGGDSARAAHGRAGLTTRLTLDRILEADGALFTRYIRA
jgi:hypothetical protein